MVFSRIISTFLPLAVLLVPVVRSHEVAPLHSRQSKFGPSSLGPQNDPFYKPAKGWEQKKLGTVLRWRQINVNNADVAAEYQLLYRTQSQNGTALSTVTTVFVPPGASTDRLVATARFDNTINVECAPSWLFTNGSVIDTPLLQKKYVVTSMDHLGPDGAMSAYRLSGRLQLDAARATLSFAPAGLTKKTKIVLHGYSGGAGTCGWAASQAHTYAPELQIVGAVFGGTPGDMYNLSKIVDGGPFAGLGFSGAFGISHAYKAVDTTFVKVLTPLAKQQKAKTEQGCLVEAFTTFIGQRLLSDKYNTLGASMLDEPSLYNTLASLKLGDDPKALPTMPVFLLHGMVDEIIPIRTMDPIADKLGASGVDLLYLRTAAADHFADYLNTNIVAFMEHRFNGLAWPKGYRKINNGGIFDKVDFTTAKSNVMTPHQRSVEDAGLAKNEALAKRILSLPGEEQQGALASIYENKRL